MSNTRQPSFVTVRWGPQLVTDVANSPDLATAASHLVARGIPVFPCRPGGKRPLTPHGFHDASADPALIDSWWRRHPHANIGIPTGDVGGIDVVDVDIHPGGSGFASFERAYRAGLLQGWAWVVRTPSGGLHAYFLRASQSELRSWQAPRIHIDFRGDGGYIIAPPSRILGDDGVGRGYELLAVAGDRRLQPANATGLRAFLDPPRRLRPPKAIPAKGALPDHLAAWVASRPEGARNGGLFWAACRMAENGHPMSATSQLLGAAAQAAGLTEPEALGTIHSAYRTASRSSRGSEPRSTTRLQVVEL